MKTLLVYYSKTGNSRKLAEMLQKKLKCDQDELQYNEREKGIITGDYHDPNNYDLVILVSPIWAFGLAAPMKCYINKHKSGIKAYKLAVTCGGLGLFGARMFCKNRIGKNPEKAAKYRAGAVKKDKIVPENIL